jgi:hypothetical protein
MKFGTWVILGMANDVTIDSCQFGLKNSMFGCPDHKITGAGHMNRTLQWSPL